MLRSTLFTLLFALQASSGKAQSNSTLGVHTTLWSVRGYHFADRSDSSAFQQFIQSLRTDTVPRRTGGTPMRYRQVWQISEHGGLAVVSRGDGTELIRSEGPIVDIGLFGDIEFRTADGKRGVMRIDEYPCAMICKTTTYYLEE